MSRSYVLKLDEQLASSLLRPSTILLTNNRKVIRLKNQSNFVPKCVSKIRFQPRPRLITWYVSTNPQRATLVFAPLAQPISSSLARGITLRDINQITSMELICYYVIAMWE